jgi:hypothetical protein
MRDIDLMRERQSFTAAENYISTEQIQILINYYFIARLIEAIYLLTLVPVDIIS